VSREGEGCWGSRRSPQPTVGSLAKGGGL